MKLKYIRDFFEIVLGILVIAFGIVYLSFKGEI